MTRRGILAHRGLLVPIDEVVFGSGGTMRYVRGLGLMLAGAGIAVALMSIGEPAQAQAQAGSRMRLFNTGNDPNDRPFMFVYDTKSLSCWIVYRSSDGAGMAPAPTSACAN